MCALFAHISSPHFTPAARARFPESWRRHEGTFDWRGGGEGEGGKGRERGRDLVGALKSLCCNSADDMQQEKKRQDIVCWDTSLSLFFFRPALPDQTFPFSPMHNFVNLSFFFYSRKVKLTGVTVKNSHISLLGSSSLTRSKKKRYESIVTTVWSGVCVCTFPGVTVRHFFFFLLKRSGRR